MTRRTIQELVTQANSSLPDNTAEAIEPADVRNMILDFLDTVTPMYGGLNIASKTVSLTTQPQVLIFDTSIASFPPEWTTSPSTGTISRNLNQVAAITSRILVSGFIEGPQGDEIRIALYKNGAALSNWLTEETMEGPSKSVGFQIYAIDAGTVNAEYKLMVSSTAGSPTMTLRDVLFLGENIPVRAVAAGQFVS